MNEPRMEGCGPLWWPENHHQVVVLVEGPAAAGEVFLPAAYFLAVVGPTEKWKKYNEARTLEMRW